MQDFVARNPGFVLWLLSLVGTFMMVLVGLIGHLLSRSQKQEREAWQGAVGQLSQTLTEMKDGVTSTAREVFDWMRGAESRLSRLEAQHDLNHRRGGK